MLSYDVILHPTDFSETSDSAFKVACQVARDHFASLVVLHVLPPRDHTHILSEEEVENDPDPVIHSCHEHFRRMRALAQDIPISFQVAYGYGVGVILNVAHLVHADLIVIASDENSRFHLHGSLVEGILRQTHCPVVIFREPGATLKGRMCRPPLCELLGKSADSRRISSIGQT